MARLHGLYAGCIVYADDISLLAYTSYALQKMVDICNDEITALDLHFNVVKSVDRRVGPRWSVETKPRPRHDSLQDKTVSRQDMCPETPSLSSTTSNGRL